MPLRIYEIRLQIIAGRTPPRLDILKEHFQQNKQCIRDSNKVVLLSCHVRVTKIYRLALLVYIVSLL